MALSLFLLVLAFQGVALAKSRRRETIERSVNITRKAVLDIVRESKQSILAIHRFSTVGKNDSAYEEGMTNPTVVLWRERLLQVFRIRYARVANSTRGKLGKHITLSLNLHPLCLAFFVSGTYSLRLDQYDGT